MPAATRSLLRHGRAPLLASWIVTNRCNLRCVYCACPDNVRPDELSAEEALDVVDQLAAMGVAAVHLTGGEPLVRKDTPALIQRLRFHSIRTSLSSNGTLVPRKIRALDGCAEVSLSLDGPPAVHDRNRADGQVAEVLAALDALQQRSIGRKLQCLVTSRTTDECLDFVLRTARSYGCRVYFQPALDVVLATHDPNPVVAQAARVREVFEDLEARLGRGEPVGNSVDGLRHLSTWPSPRPLRCPVNRMAVRITPEGTLLPCHERADVPDGEDIRQGGVAAAFARLRLRSCTECWGYGRTELRGAVTGGPRALIDFLRSD